MPDLRDPRFGVVADDDGEVAAMELLEVGLIGKGKPAIVSHPEERSRYGLEQDDRDGETDDDPGHGDGRVSETPAPRTMTRIERPRDDDDRRERNVPAVVRREAQPGEHPDADGSHARQCVAIGGTREHPHRQGEEEGGVHLGKSGTPIREEACRQRK